MRLVFALFALLLAGCGTLQGFTPYVADITDAAALKKDIIDCRLIAADYPRRFDLSAIGNAATQGAAKNAAAAAVNPWTPVLGAAGNGSAVALEELGLSDTAQIRVFLRCLDHRAQKSGAYSLVDPNL